MYRTELCSLLGVSVLALAAIGATAQTAPKIKPGLWQIHMEQERNGQKMPNASERMKDHMKDMTPEQRKQFEEMMPRAPANRRSRAGPGLRRGAAAGYRWVTAVEGVVR
jgi:Spy/CpxP family protein refolding chaperone